VEQQPNQDAVGEQSGAAKDKGLPQNGGHHGNVHRVPNVAIDSGDDQAAGGKDRGGGAQALHHEADKAVEQTDYSHGGQYSAGEREKRYAEERWAYLPTGYPSGNEDDDRSGRDGEEEQRADVPLQRGI
jgi:hypothetical protein